MEGQHRDGSRLQNSAEETSGFHHRTPRRSLPGSAGEAQSHAFLSARGVGQSQLSSSSYAAEEQDYGDVPRDAYGKREKHGETISRRRSSSPSFPTSSIPWKRKNLLASSRRRRFRGLSLVLLSIVFLVVRHFILKCREILVRRVVDHGLHGTSIEGRAPRLLASGGGEDETSRQSEALPPDIFYTLSPSLATSLSLCFEGEWAGRGGNVVQRGPASADSGSSEGKEDQDAPAPAPHIDSHAASGSSAGAPGTEEAAEDTGQTEENPKTQIHWTRREEDESLPSRRREWTTRARGANPATVGAKCLEQHAYLSPHLRLVFILSL